MSKIKIGIDLFPRGVKKCKAGKVCLTYDILLGFHFKNDILDFSKDHIDECRMLFQNILDKKLSIKYKDHADSLIAVKELSFESVLKNKEILKKESWDTIFSNSTKYSIQYCSLAYALSQSNDALKNFILKDSNEIGQVSESFVDRLYDIDKKSNSVIRNIDSLNKKQESAQLRARRMTSKVRTNVMSVHDSMNFKEHLVFGNYIQFKQIFKEILVHPILAREHFGLWHSFSVPYVDVGPLAHTIRRVELIIYDSGKDTSSHKVDFCDKNGNSLVHDTSVPVVAYLDNYKVETHILSNGNVKYYHGHQNYGIIKYDRDPNDNFNIFLKSAVHNTAMKKVASEDRSILIDKREDIEEFSNHDIDGLFIYHDLGTSEEKALLENPNYGVIGQNTVVLKSYNGEIETLHSLCSRHVNYEPNGFKNISDKPEEGWIFVNANVLAKKGQNSVEYSDPILFAWEGDNLAIPKPAVQVTSDLSGEYDSQNDEQKAQTQVKKFLTEHVFRFNRGPKPSSNIRFNANTKYRFLLKYVGVNGYTLPMINANSDVELSLNDLRTLSTDTIKEDDPFNKAWIHYDGFQATPEYFTIQPPLLLGSVIYDQEKKPRQATIKRKSQPPKRATSTYGENDSSIIIRHIPERNDILEHKTRYIFPPMVELKELEFLGYFEKDKLNYGTDRKDYLKKCEAYHKRAKKDQIFEVTKYGKKKFNKRKIDYIADPRARKLMLTAHDWKTANTMDICGIDRANFKDFFPFDAAGKFDVFKNVKPGRMTVFGNRMNPLSLTLGTSRLRINLQRGMIAKFRIHLFQDKELTNFFQIDNDNPDNTGTTVEEAIASLTDAEKIFRLYSEHPFSDFKVCHASKKPLKLDFDVPRNFADTNGYTARRPRVRSFRDHYYYEFDFNPDPSRIQILFGEYSDHIMSDNSFIPNDHYLVDTHDIPTSYDRDFLANQEYLNAHEYLTYNNKLDEVPPNYLRVNNRVFEEKPQLNDDIFRREFGVDCSFSDEEEIPIPL